MRSYISLFLIVCCQLVFGQTRFSPSITDSVLFSTMNRYTNVATDPEVTDIVKAVDRKYRFIADTIYRFKSLRYTIFQSVYISFRKLVSASEATRMILTDTSRYKSQIFDLSRFNHDTTRFLNFHLDGHDLPQPYSDSLFPVETELLNPLQMGLALQTTSIIFNNPYLQKLKDSLGRRLNRKERAVLNDYLFTRYDYFDPRHHRFQAKAVRILYIITGPGTLRYVGIDIYGRHFLWTLDQNMNYQVIKAEGLWVY